MTQEHILQIYRLVGNERVKLELISLDLMKSLHDLKGEPSVFAFDGKHILLWPRPDKRCHYDLYLEPKDPGEAS